MDSAHARLWWKASMVVVVVVVLLLMVAIGSAAAVRKTQRARPMPQGTGSAAVQVVVTADGVALVQKALHPKLVDQLLSSLHLPPMAGSQNVSLLGVLVKADYSVANVSIANVSFDDGAAPQWHHS